MKVQEKDLYHGAALTQIVEHPSFKALNKADDKYGHYLVNHDRRILAKYTKKVDSPWQFTFSEDDMRIVGDNLRTKGDTRAFICLVCGDKTVCLLDEKEIWEVLDLSRVAWQWIKVDAPKGCSMHVAGSKGVCKRTVSHSCFPDKLFNARRMVIL